MSVSRSQFVRHSLQLTIGRLRHTGTSDRHTPGSPSSSSPRTRVTTSPSYHSFNQVICSVLCLFDYTSLDPDHLPFRINEILEVVKQDHDDSGWWAAMRSVASGGKGRPRWIPKFFVVPLEDEMALRLKETPEDLRGVVFEAERFCRINPVSRSNRPHEKAGERESKVRKGSSSPLNFGC
jgi:son of sevenless